MRCAALTIIALAVLAGCSTVPSRYQTTAAQRVQKIKPKDVKTCTPYLDTVVAPKSFKNAIAGMKAMAPKSEYETTAAFEARKDATLAAIPAPLIISKVPESDEYVKYDADSQALIVKSFAFDNTNFDPWKAFYPASINDINVSTIQNIDVVISQMDKTTGSYVGSTAMGARARVTKVTRTVEAIFQRSARGRADDLFRNRQKNGVIGTIEMSAQEAQRVKPGLKLAFVVWPKSPLLIRSSYALGEVTFDNPRELTVNAAVLVGDIECGLLLTKDNKVIGAFEAQAHAKD